MHRQDQQPTRNRFNHQLHFSDLVIFLKKGDVTWDTTVEVKALSCCALHGNKNKSMQVKNRKEQLHRNHLTFSKSHFPISTKNYLVIMGISLVIFDQNVKTHLILSQVTRIPLL